MTGFTYHDLIPWPRFLRLLLAPLLGALSVLAYAPYHLGVLLLFCLAVLILLWRMDVSPKQAAITGYLFGLGQMAVGVSWVNVSIAQFGGLPAAGAMAITVAFVLIVAGYFALASWLIKLLHRREHEVVWMLLVIPAIWGLTEWLRSWLFTGFPWLSVGYSQIDLPLAGFAQYIGVFGVGMMLLVSAGLLHQWKRWWAIISLAGLWLAAMGFNQLQWSQSAGDTVRVSLLQGNFAQADKWRPEMFLPTLDAYVEMTEAATDSRLIVWPETAVPSFSDRVEGRLLTPLHDKMKRQGKDLLLGIPVRETKEVYYNGMISLGASGRDAYYKRHLVPFGEYLPLKFLIGGIVDFLQIPVSNFTAGNPDEPPLVELVGHQAGIDICYEDAFGSAIIKALPDAAFLINASNDAWFGDSLAPPQHLQIARMRALESGRYLLRATNTGISAIIDNKGRVLNRSKQFKRMMLTGDIEPLTGLTPYAALGNTVVLVLAFFMLFIAYAAVSSGAKWAPARQH